MAQFVANPSGGADGRGAPFEPYPTLDNPREPKPYKAFEPALQKRNADLLELKEPPVEREEFLAARLYTGPVRRPHPRTRCTSFLSPLHRAGVTPAPTPPHLSFHARPCPRESASEARGGLA